MPFNHVKSANAKGSLAGAFLDLSAACVPTAVAGASAAVAETPGTDPRPPELLAVTEVAGVAEPSELAEVGATVAEAGEPEFDVGDSAAAAG